MTSLSTLSFSFSANKPEITPFNLSFSSSFSLTSSLITKFDFSIYKTNSEQNQEVTIMGEALKGPGGAPDPPNFFISSVMYVRFV
ncbi:hypothetical protein Hanom_Chr11g01056121 [Helianthus anomalus]